MCQWHKNLWVLQIVFAIFIVNSWINKYDTAHDNCVKDKELCFSWIEHKTMSITKHDVDMIQALLKKSYWKYYNIEMPYVNTYNKSDYQKTWSRFI